MGKFLLSSVDFCIFFLFYLLMSMLLCIGDSYFGINLSYNILMRVVGFKVFCLFICLFLLSTTIRTGNVGTASRIWSFGPISNLLYQNIWGVLMSSYLLSHSSSVITIEWSSGTMFHLNRNNSLTGHGSTCLQWRHEDSQFKTSLHCHSNQGQFCQDNQNKIKSVS